MPVISVSPADTAVTRIIYWRGLNLWMSAQQAVDVGVRKSVHSLWIECVPLHCVEKEWPRDLHNRRHWMINESSRKETVTWRVEVHEVKRLLTSFLWRIDGGISISLHWMGNAEFPNLQDLGLHVIRNRCILFWTESFPRHPCTIFSLTGCNIESRCGMQRVPT